MYPFVEINSLQISTFLICIVLGFIAAGILLRKQFIESTLTNTWLWAFITAVAVPLAMIGTHIDEFVPMILQQFVSKENIEAVENIISYSSGWFNGFVLSVGVILLALKIFKAPIIYVCDLAAPSIAIGQFFGRIGCFFAGDGCYGRATDLPWGMAFPDGVVPISIPVHPTPLYEAALHLLIFLFLWRLRRQGLPEGTSIALYLFLSGTERFFVEFIRLNAKFMFNLTAPQIFSVIFIIVGGRMLYKRRSEIQAVLFSPPQAAQPLET